MFKCTILYAVYILFRSYVAYIRWLNDIFATLPVTAFSFSFTAVVANQKCQPLELFWEDLWKVTLPTLTWLE